MGGRGRGGRGRRELWKSEEVGQVRMGGNEEGGGWRKEMIHTKLQLIYRKSSGREWVSEIEKRRERMV